MVLIVRFLHLFAEIVASIWHDSFLGVQQDLSQSRRREEGDRGEREGGGRGGWQTARGLNIHKCICIFVISILKCTCGFIHLHNPIYLGAFRICLYMQTCLWVYLYIYWSVHADWFTCIVLYIWLHLYLCVYANMFMGMYICNIYIKVYIRI